jgi:hypothetical protein
MLLVSPPRLEDLVRHECYLSACRVLHTVINCLKVDVDWLCQIDGAVHALFAIFDVGWSDFTLSINK